ncbi:hypothetical protein ARMGADRAFT_1017406 [Armillaria gallica]|uniref:Uncharacterized protein n=1 Tax=Armillaria gallica TaxID=47427 RepID=A0A2H3CTQ9_ARMGA|nr:hypothetical protein ARMGADRAFT_1017406 [Armillaria gallica]
MFTAAKSAAPRIRLSAFRRYSKKTQTKTDGPVQALKQDPHTDTEPSQEESASSSALPPKPVPKRLIHQVTFIHGNFPQHLQVLEELRQVEKLLPFCLHPKSRNLGHAPKTEPTALQVEDKALPTLDDVHAILDFDGMRFIRQAKAQTHSLQGLMESLERDPDCMRLPIVIDWTEKKVFLDRLSRLYPKTVYREKKIKERQILKWLIERIFSNARRGLLTSDSSNIVQAQRWFDRVKDEVQLRKSLFIETYGQPFDK